jgi:hypothetical protein
MGDTTNRPGGGRRTPAWARVATSVSALAIVLTLAVIGARGGPAEAQTATSCAADPGLTVLWDWSHGTPPPLALPGPDWQLSSHPAGPLLSFFVPPGWTTTVLDPPAWLATGPAASWAGVRVVAPDNSAAAEISSAALAGVHDATEAAWFGVSGIFGQRQPNVLCSGVAAATGASVVAAELDGLIAFVTGYAFPQASIGSTAFVYYTAIAPAATFTTVTQDVFVPLFFQFNSTGPDPGTPTTT